MWGKWKALSDRERSLWALGICFVLVVLANASSDDRASQPQPESAFVSRPPSGDTTTAAPPRAEQLEGMTQAARDAGYDEATAQQIGRDATALCNGNPECLK